MKWNETQWYHELIAVSEKESEILDSFFNLLEDEPLRMGTIQIEESDKDFTLLKFEK